MKKFICLLTAAVVSTALFAGSFDSGAYTGPVLEPTGIADLADALNGQIVAVNGVFTLQKMPGLFEFSEGEGEEKVSINVIVPPFAWSNLEIDDSTPVIVFGYVLKNGQNTILVAERIGLPPEE